MPASLLCVTLLPKSSSYASFTSCALTSSKRCTCPGTSLWLTSATASAATHLLDELRAGILKGVLQLNGPRDGHAVVDDLRHAVALLQHNVPACTKKGSVVSVVVCARTLLYGRSPPSSVLAALRLCFSTSSWRVESMVSLWLKAAAFSQSATGRPRAHRCCSPQTRPLRLGYCCARADPSMAAPGRLHVNYYGADLFLAVPIRLSDPPRGPSVTPTASATLLMPFCSRARDSLSKTIVFASAAFVTCEARRWRSALRAVVRCGGCSPLLPAPPECCRAFCFLQRVFQERCCSHEDVMQTSTERATCAERSRKHWCARRVQHRCLRLLRLHSPGESPVLVARCAVAAAAGRSAMWRLPCSSAP